MRSERREISALNFYFENTLSINELTRRAEFHMSSTGNIRTLAIVFVIVLAVAVVPVRVAAQTPPTGNLWVTYVNATPITTNTGDSLEIVFRVVYFCCDAYLGAIGKPADGIKTATFLLVSVETQQSHEYPDTPVFATGNSGEYRADVQIVPEDPAGRVWIYVKGNSLHSASCLCTANTPSETVGPPGNTASEQTYDTSDMSLIQIGQLPSPPSPSPWSALLQGNELLLVGLAAIVLLLLAISLLARRRGKPSPKP